MPDPNQITVFDRMLVCANRARAAKNFSNHSALFDEIASQLIERLGDIKYEFAAGNKLISKTVHHFLMRQVGGYLTVENDPQQEAVDVQWFEIDNLHETLAHENERRIARGVQEWIARNA